MRSWKHWGISRGRRSCRACEESSILLSMENLLTFPWIRERADAGKIEIHGWYFNMNNGEMYYYDTEQERFLLLADHH